MKLLSTLQGSGRVVLGLCLLLPALPLAAQSADALPDYQPAQQVSGTLKIWGADGMKALVGKWQEGFHKVQPGVSFDVHLISTATGVAGLYAGNQDLAVMGREIWPIEALAFHRVFGYEPLSVNVVTGAYDKEDKTFPLVVFVHQGNPIKQLTFHQLEAVFGCESCHPGVKAVHTWGELGATGEWAARPIHTYGYAVDSGFAFFFDHNVMRGDTRWNGGMKTFDTIDTPGQPRNAGGAQILHALADDPNGIAYSGIRYPTPGTVPIALAATDAGPFIASTRENVANRTYPLTRTDPIIVNRKPGTPLDPKVREFLAYVLSRQGQQDVTREGEFLPLPPAYAATQRKLIE